MPAIQSPQILGQAATTYRGDGALFMITSDIDLAANAATNDTLEFVKLDPGVQVEDYTVINAPTALVFTLGEMNAGKTAIATTWKAGIAAFQRMDNGTPRANNNVQRVIGGLVTTGSSTTGRITLQLFCRSV